MNCQNSDSLSLCVLNVCGLKRRLNYPEFLDFLHKYDIMCVTETKTDDSDDVNIEGYAFLSKHRSQAYKRKSGGIGVYVRNEISQYINVVHGESEYIMWLTIDKKLTNYTENAILGVTYLPPESSRFLNEDDFRTFEIEISNI